MFSLLLCFCCQSPHIGRDFSVGLVRITGFLHVCVGCFLLRCWLAIFFQHRPDLLALRDLPVATRQGRRKQVLAFSGQFSHLCDVSGVNGLKMIERRMEWNNGHHR